MAINRIAVSIPGHEPYDVRVGSQASHTLHERIARLRGSAAQTVLITDSNVGPLYLAQVKRALREEGLGVLDLTVPAGEASKSLECAGEILETMAERALGRDCVVVALGGGVIGDLAGFVAASYMRGVDLVQVPTTLLAMVDSSVGGKTAVNLAAGKNLVGFFKQPDYVCADLDFLSTLPDIQWVSGSAEIAKSALIDSLAFTEWMEERAPLLRARDADATREAIVRSVMFKSRVVAEDETESAGVRECLNFGHTFGHALEKASGFTLEHGCGVAEGMRFAARLSAALGFCPLEYVWRVDALLAALGLPELDAAHPSVRAGSEELIAAMHQDKKNRGGQIRFVLPDSVGAWHLERVDDFLLREHVEAWVASRPEPAGEGAEPAGLGGDGDGQVVPAPGSEPSSGSEAR